MQAKWLENFKEELDFCKDEDKGEFKFKQVMENKRRRFRHVVDEQLPLFRNILEIPDPVAEVNISRKLTCN